MRKLALILGLLISQAAFAATPNITELECVKDEVGTPTLWCGWLTDVVGSSTEAYLAFDFEGDDWDYSTSWEVVQSSSIARRRDSINRIAPSSTVWIMPKSRDTTTNWSADFQCPVTCTDCDSTDDPFFKTGGSGVDCVSGQSPRVVFGAATACPGGGSAPCEPVAPIHTGLTACPVITGTTRTVAGDGSDFNTLFADAKADADSGGLVEGVVVPPNVAIRPETFSLNQFSLSDVIIDSPGMVVIKPSSDPKLLPPPGTMTNPSFFPYMGRFEVNTNAARVNGLSGGLIWQGGGNSGARGYCLENIIHTYPPIEDVPVITVAVTAINTTTDTLTGDDLTGLETNMIVHVDLPASVESAQYQRAQGPRVICNVSGTVGGTFKLAQLFAFNECGSVVDFTGSNCSGSCGEVQQFTAKPIEAISNTTPVELTITGHGLGNLPALTIDGSTAATNVTVVESLGPGSSVAVDVRGTGVSTCDGPWISGTVSGGVVPLLPRVGTTTAADCTGATIGTVQRVLALSIVGTSDPELGSGQQPKQFGYYVVDDDTIELLGSTAQGAISTLGYMFSEVRVPNNATFNFGSGSSTPPLNSDFTCDRCAFYAPYPWRSRGDADFSRGNQISFVNGWHEGAFWNRYNPISGDKETSDTLTNGDGSRLNFLVTFAQDVQILNNVLYNHPMIFSDTPSTRSTEDFSINKNVFWEPDVAIPNHPDFNSMRLGMTFCIEFKDLLRGAVVGNYTKGCYSNRQPTQSWAQFSGIGRTDATPNTVGDLRFAYNTVERSGGGFHVTVSGEKDRMRTQNKRILLEHNLAVDWSPSYDGLGDSSRGLFWNQAGDATDVIVRRNTYWPHGNPNPLLWRNAGDWSQSCLNSLNIYLASEGSNSTSIGVGSYISGNRVPAILTGTYGEASILDFYKSGTANDPNCSFDDNKIIPGIESSNSGTYSVKRASDADADTISADEAGDKAQLTFASWTNPFVGDAAACVAGVCPDTLAEREESVFEPGTWVPKVAYDGYGADISDLEDAQGWVTGVVVTADHESAALAYHAPTTTGCWARIAPWDTDYATTFSNPANITGWTQDASASQSQSISFTGLTAETEYAYDIACSKPASGKFTTAGTP